MTTSRQEAIFHSGRDIFDEQVGAELGICEKTVFNVRKRALADLRQNHLEEVLDVLMEL